MNGEVMALPTDRRQRLKELETVIASGFDGVAELGRALREIRDDGLYLEVGAGTFEQYAKSRWSIAIRTAYQQIDAADIQDACAQLRTPVPIANEAVGRELAPILHQQGPAKVAEAWSKVSAAYEGKRAPTAVEVHRILVAEGYRPPVGHASSGPVNLRILLGQVGDKIVATEKRLEWFIGRDVPKRPSAGKSTRDLAVSYAERCERMAQLLRDFAEGDAP